MNFDHLLDTLKACATAVAVVLSVGCTSLSNGSGVAQERILIDTIVRSAVSNLSNHPVDNALARLGRPASQFDVKTLVLDGPEVEIAKATNHKILLRRASQESRPAVTLMTIRITDPRLCINVHALKNQVDAKLPQFRSFHMIYYELNDQSSGNAVSLSSDPTPTVRERFAPELIAKIPALQQQLNVPKAPCVESIGIQQSDK